MRNKTITSLIIISLTVMFVFNMNADISKHQKLVTHVLLSTIKSQHYNPADINDDFSKNIIIQCRESEIAQVLFNLVSNAGDAVADLSERWIKLDYQNTAEEANIRIMDSGPGIPEEIQQKIFHPFFTTKDIGKGTGLGLAVSVGIIESHGGKIDIDSSSPNTTFIIKIPKVQIQKTEDIS